MTHYTFLFHYIIRSDGVANRLTPQESYRFTFLFNPKYSRYVFNEIKFLGSIKHLSLFYLTVTNFMFCIKHFRTCVLCFAFDWLWCQKLKKKIDTHFGLSCCHAKSHTKFTPLTRFPAINIFTANSTLVTWRYWLDSWSETNKKV